MLKHLLFVLVIIFCTNSQAQFFTYFPDEGAGGVAFQTRSFKDGYLWYLNTQNNSTLQHKRMLSRVQADGNILWTLEIDGGAGITAIGIDNNDKLILGCSGMSGASVTGSIVQKQDTTGAIDWAVTINAGIVNIEVTDEIIYAAVTRGAFIGNTYYHNAAIVGISHEGQVLWHKKFSGAGLTTDFVFSRTALTSTGDFIGVADIRGSSGTPANGMAVTRINAEGEIAFTKYYDFRTTHNQLAVNGLAVIENDEIVFGGRLMTDQISTYPNKMWLGKLDGSGNEILQKIYHGGEDVGEQLQSLRYVNNTLYGSIQPFSPFMDVARSNMVVTINTQSLSIESQNAVEIELAYEDPYGQTRNTFDIGSDGGMLSVGNFYCTDQQRYIPYMIKYDNQMNSSCESLETTMTFSDSTSSYIGVNFSGGSGVSFTFGTTSGTTMTEITPLNETDLCGGCALPIISVIENEKTTLSIYPNPAQQAITIKSNENMLVDYIIHDMQGRLVLSGKSFTNSSIDISSVASGTYLIKTPIATELLIVN